MPVKATFNVDFTSFQSEVDKAIVSFTRFEGESTKVAAQLSTLGNQFTGTKVIAEATLMAEAIKQVGGAAMLTDAELKKVATTAGVAADKFLAFGQQVPKSLQGLIADVTKARTASEAYRLEVASWEPAMIRTASAIQNLQGAVGSFNSALVAAGLHGVRADLGALVELGGAMGTTVSEFGLLASAGLSVAAALGVWKLGRLIADVTDADAVIANSTAALLGWGDAAKKSAAAGADTLAAASRRAGESITNMSEALAINQVYLENLQRKQAPAETLDQIKKWAAEITQVDQAGVLKNLTADVQSHNFSMKQLADLYHVSEGAISGYMRRLQELDKLETERKKHAGDLAAMMKDAVEAQDKALDKAKEAADKLAESIAKLERAGTPAGTTAGLLGLNAEEQRRTQAQFAQASNLTAGPRVAAAVDTTNPLAVFTDDLKQAHEQMERNVALGEDRYLAELDEKTKITAANQKFLDSMLKGAAANDAWIKSLTPKEADTILPWSSLTPKPIAVRPIVPGSFGGAGAGASAGLIQINVSGVLDPRTITELTDAISAELLRRAGRR